MLLARLHGKFQGETQNFERWAHGFHGGEASFLSKTQVSAFMKGFGQCSCATHSELVTHTSEIWPTAESRASQALQPAPASCALAPDPHSRI